MKYLKINRAKKIYQNYKQKMIEDFEKDGMPLKGGIATKIFLFIGGVLDVFVHFTYYPFEDYVISRKISPFIKEWILVFAKWSFIGPLCLFLLLIFNLMDTFSNPRIEIIIDLLVYFPLCTLVVITLLMPTPRRELADMLFRRKLRKRKKVMIGSVETFRTSFLFDLDERFDPISDIYALDSGTEAIFPVRFLCAELPEDHIPRSSAPKYDIAVGLRYDPDTEPEYEHTRATEPIIMNAACEGEDLYQWKIRPRMVISESGLDVFIALQKMEPSMEFEVEYLFFSKLLTGIYPIEGYEYPEGVTELLAKLNRSVNPWIKK